MNAYAPGTGTIQPAKDPVCRVVWNAWSSQVYAVAVWNPPTWTWDTVRPAGRFASEVQAAEDAWKTSDMLRGTVDALLDPEIFIIRAAAEVAALHAGFPLPVARRVGQIAGDIGQDILRQDRRASRAEVALWVEFAFSAETGAWIGTSALDQRDLARVSELVGPDGGGLAPDKPLNLTVEDPSPIAPRPYKGPGFSP